MSAGRTFATKVDPSARRGVMAWFIQNPVAANIIVLLVCLGGLITLFRTKQEVFPEVDLDLIVPRHASPVAGRRREPVGPLPAQFSRWRPRTQVLR